jgi:hypothetical protein
MPSLIRATSKFICEPKRFVAWPQMGGLPEIPLQCGRRDTPEEPSADDVVSSLPVFQFECQDQFIDRLQQARLYRLVVKS